MVARKSGRYLAPVALIAVAVAVGLIVHAQTEGRHSAAPRPAATTAAHHLSAARRLPQKQMFYVIKPGDNLSSISVKTGISIATLEALNPSINPAALQTGQRIRLRR